MQQQRNIRQNVQEQENIRQKLDQEDRERQSRGFGPMGVQERFDRQQQEFTGFDSQGNFLGGMYVGGVVLACITSFLHTLILKESCIYKMLFGCRVKYQDNSVLFTLLSY